MLILKNKISFQTVRQNRLTPHYREMFGEPGNRLDPSSSAPGPSSAPGSSRPETVPETQSSQRVSRLPFSGAPSVPRIVAPPVPHAHVPKVPPLMAPPMPAMINPDLMMPPSSPYSQYTFEDLLAQPQRRFISPRPRPIRRNFVLSYIFLNYFKILL